MPVTPRSREHPSMHNRELADFVVGTQRHASKRKELLGNLIIAVALDAVPPDTPVRQRPRTLECPRAEVIDSLSWGRCDLGLMALELCHHCIHLQYCHSPPTVKQEAAS